MLLYLYSDVLVVKESHARSAGFFVCFSTNYGYRAILSRAGVRHDNLFLNSGMFAFHIPVSIDQGRHISARTSGNLYAKATQLPNGLSFPHPFVHSLIQQMVPYFSGC